VVVRRQIDDVAAVVPAPRGLRVLERPDPKQQPARFELVELFLQKLQPRAHGSKITFPDFPDRTVSKASANSDSANRCVITGVTSTMPVARSVEVCSHVPNSSRPVTPKRRASLKMTFSAMSSVTG